MLLRLVLFVCVVMLGTQARVLYNIHDAGMSGFFAWLRKPRQNNGNATEAYCNIDPEHTMCLFQGQSEDCEDRGIYRQLSESAKTLLLDRHNELRAKVANGSQADQPQAANMRKLVWSDELEEIAQRWADQCTWGHDGIRNKMDNTYVGQNLYSSSTSNQRLESQIQADVAAAVDSWYSEVDEPGFNSENIEPFSFDFGTGHYTQTVWADTSEVGCGLMYYRDGEWYSSFIVCNYAIGGNFQGDSMYIIGEPCSQCPPGTQCDDNGLCETL